MLPFKIILIILLAVISNNGELVNYWVNSDLDTNKMFGISKEERKSIASIKKLSMSFFIVFFIFFLILAKSYIKA